MPLSLIVAMTRAGVIGRGGDLPWRLSADLQRFKRLTMGHHIVMGRKTFDSLQGRTLPGRTLMVISRAAEARGEGVLLARGLDEALGQCAGDAEPFVIGGGEIFRLALPLAERLYVTYVEADLTGDTYFPAWDASQWRLVESTPVAADAKNEFPTTYCVYERLR